MSARHLQGIKPVPSEEYKRVGVIVLTTLAVNGAPGQSANLPVLGSTEGSNDTDGANRRAQQHGLNTESSAASAPRPEGTSCSPTEDMMPEGGLLTDQECGVCKSPAPLKAGANLPLAQSGEPVESEQVSVEATLESGSPILESDTHNDFHKAAVRPLSILERQSECEDSGAKKSIELKIPHTEQGHGVSKNAARLEDGESSLLAKSGEPVESKRAHRSILAHLEATPESGPSVIGWLLKSYIDHVFHIIETDGIRNDFHKAALRPLPISEDRSDPQAKKSVELDVPRFLHPDNHVDNPRSEDVEKIVNLHLADQSMQAFSVMRAQFSKGGFEKHLFSFLRQRMFYWSKRHPRHGSNALPGTLVHRYTREMQKWCASVFDATVRRVKFAIDPVKSCLSREGPITETNCDSKGKIPSDLEEEKGKAPDWLRDYLQAEREFRTAVNKCKNMLSQKAHEEWIAYKKQHFLTSSTTKTRRLKQPLRAKTYLLKNTHFISWVMRRMTPAFFLCRRHQIIDAIRAIEGKTSMLADVLENLSVQDLEAFGKTREMLEKERFHSYVKVPQN